MDRDQLQKAAWAAGAALVLGAIGPWTTAFGVSVAGVEGDGVLTLIGAIAGLAALLWWKRATVALAIAAIVLLIAIIDFIDVLSEEIVGVGWGLYLTLAGAALLVYVSFQLRGSAGGDPSGTGESGTGESPS